MKSVVILREAAKKNHTISYYILIGNNYIFIIYLGIISFHFLVIDTLRRIMLFPCVSYWIKN